MFNEITMPHMKVIGKLGLALLLFVSPIFAQRHGGGGGRIEGGGREVAAPRSNEKAQPSKSAPRISRTGKPQPNGRLLSNAWKARYLGYRFRPSRMIIMPGGGYRFWYGGRWFWFGPPYPMWWWPGWWEPYGFYWIDCPDDGPCMLYNTYYPYFGLTIGVVF
jgi:hypothetical protein